ncbi:MAG: hypothetical protein HWN67_22225 [Candidatus Helarchaeota archaeon]|nr:hypothetical protein [Candidatus Helarchaeota archaeon]
MDKKGFLKGFIIFSGYLEIAFGVVFIFFIDILLKPLGLTNLPLFYQMAGFFFILLGALLAYSAKDIERYLIIPITSIILRFGMPVFEIYNMLLFPQLVLFLLPGAIYDGFSSILTLILLKKCNYI